MVGFASWREGPEGAGDPLERVEVLLLLHAWWGHSLASDVFDGRALMSSKQCSGFSGHVGPAAPPRN